IHEICHPIFFLDSTFMVAVKEGLDTMIRQMALRGIADGETTRERTRSHQRKLRELWDPLPSCLDWAHELAIDVMCTWLLGPLYSEYMIDTVEAGTLNP